MIDDVFTATELAAWGGLLGMHGRMMRKIDADLQAFGQITHAEFEVLLRLYWTENQRLRIQDLAAQSILTRSGISRVVERLERGGLVKRVEADEDRRGAYAILTESGAIHFRKVATHHAAFVRQQFLAYFSEDELRQMAAFWQRVNAGSKEIS